MAGESYTGIVLAGGQSTRMGTDKGRIMWKGRTLAEHAVNTLKADKTWMITRQLGYQNNYVMMGGLNYWAEAIINPEPPPSTSPDEELAKYDFRKGAGMALGGAAASSNNDQPLNKPALPVIKSKPKKTRVQGGC